ncbi:hypothetical protein ES703_110584 [subsurface metagenome]
MNFPDYFNKLFPWGRQRCVLLLVLSALVLGITQEALLAQDANNFQIDGTLPFGDMPYIWILFRRTPGGEPLADPQELLVQAYYDSGASGVLLSRETRDILGITAEPNASFVDVGVGGEEVFEVSEPLYIALADHDLMEEPDEGDFHEDLGPWRLMLTIDEVQDVLQQPIDVVGVPGMAGKTVVLKVELFDIWGMLIPYYVTQIMESNDPCIPELDIEIKVQFTNFLYTSHPGNNGPLPVLAYNPVIEGIQIGYEDNNSMGDWLVDTGAQLSMISSAQAINLGLLDPNGDPIVEPEFYLPIGGIGSDVLAPVFLIDTLAIHTLNGFKLIYGNPYVGVLDIGTIDERTGEPIILDGVFGANFLGYSYNMDLDIVMGPYDSIVFDTQRAIIGFDVNDIYPVPDNPPDVCGDVNHPWPEGDINRDCRTDMEDLGMLSDEWLTNNCDWLNWNCSGSDLKRDGRVNFQDMAVLTRNWLDSTFDTPGN